MQKIEISPDMPNLAPECFSDEDIKKAETRSRVCVQEYRLGEVRLDEPDIVNFPLVNQVVSDEAQAPNDAGDAFLPKDTQKSNVSGYVPITLQRKAPRTYAPNSPCPCGKKRDDGRGVKYKKCCMSIDMLAS